MKGAAVKRQSESYWEGERQTVRTLHMASGATRMCHVVREDGRAWLVTMAANEPPHAAKLVARHLRNRGWQPRSFESQAALRQLALREGRLVTFLSAEHMSQQEREFVERVRSGLPPEPPAEKPLGVNDHDAALETCEGYWLVAGRAAGPEGVKCPYCKRMVRVVVQNGAGRIGIHNPPNAGPYRGL